MRKRALLTLALAALIAVAGVVYAHWEETLTVDVDITTGDIDPAWSLGTPATSDNAVGNPVPANCDGLEYCDPNTLTGADPSGPGMSPTREEKAVASCEAAIVGNELQVDITNGYPSYWCTVSVDLHNYGSVPVKMQDLSFTQDPEIDVSFSGDTEFMACGYQLDPGAVVLFEMNLHINNTALENDDNDYPGSYGLNLGLTWYNWNEYDADECDGPSEYMGSMLTGGGWWGWSCPPGSIVVGGYFEIPAGSTFTVGGEGPAYPGALAVGGYDYPVYPNYTYTAPEQGYVGFAGTYGQARIHVLCLP